MCTHIELLHFRCDIWYFCLVCRQPALLIQRKAPNLHSLAAGSVYLGSAVCLPAWTHQKKIWNKKKKTKTEILQGRSRGFNKYYMAPVAYLAHAGPWASWITNAHNKIPCLKHRKHESFLLKFLSGSFTLERVDIFCVGPKLTVERALCECLLLIAKDLLWHFTFPSLRELVKVIIMGTASEKTHV